MAPSGEHRPTDLGSTKFTAAATALFNRATALRQQAGAVGSCASGKRVDTACGQLITQAEADEQSATRLAETAKAIKIREQAAAAWNRDAPKDSEISAAKKKVDTTHAALVAAMDAVDTSTGSAQLDAMADEAAASKAWNAAVAHLTDLKQKRKAADDAYDKAEKKAEALLNGIKGKIGSVAETSTGGSGMDLPGTPSPGTGAPSTTPKPATAPATSGTAGSGGSPAAPSTGAKPGTTSAATPAATPGTPAGTSTDPTTAEVAALLASSKGSGQTTSTPASSTPAATPAAATTQPQQTTPAAQQGTADDKRRREAEDVGDAALNAAGIGAGASLGGMPPMPTVPQAGTPTVTPSAQVMPEVPAMPSVPAAPLSTTAINPQVSGTSATGMRTAEDVSGGAPVRTAFTPPAVSPATVVSGTQGTAQAGALGSGTHPTQSGGLPMNPAAMGGGMPGGSAQAKAAGERAKIPKFKDPNVAEVNGETTISEAVRGGTIGQNRDNPAA